ncbi:hypothetical protein B0H16DRAFT_1555970 [Mycena metata]|uniref:Uncharacterized protein n=1 Tax=Mycena metata TaxID=1033252 RepID=A0AAD7IQV0_9AGAR|nr:hypothetical protein B0H16DRAFT_1555970 [Mycena metata]
MSPTSLTNRYRLIYALCLLQILITVPTISAYPLTDACARFLQLSPAFHASTTIWTMYTRIVHPKAGYSYSVVILYYGLQGMGCLWVSLPAIHLNSPPSGLLLHREGRARIRTPDERIRVLRVDPVFVVRSLEMHPARARRGPPRRDDSRFLPRIPRPQTPCNRALWDGDGRGAAGGIFRERSETGPGVVGCACRRCYGRVPAVDAQISVPYPRYHGPTEECASLMPDIYLSSFDDSQELDITDIELARSGPIIPEWNSDQHFLCLCFTVES